MKIIKGIMEEELQNSLWSQKEREKALAALLRGVLVKRFVKGHQYSSLMMREGSKVHFENKGKLLGKEIRYCEEVSKDRERHRQLPADVTKQLHCSGGRCGEENCAVS
jgi:hypothetical protein